jgi:hypothetical protein
MNQAELITELKIHYTWLNNSSDKIRNELQILLQNTCVNCPNIYRCHNCKFEYLAMIHNAKGEDVCVNKKEQE